MNFTKTFEDGTEFGPAEFGIALALGAVGSAIAIGAMLWNDRRFYKKYRKKVYGEGN